MVRIGHTTIDSVTRAMQSLCQNNVLGIVVNGARRGELYSKYTYYHSYYTPKDEDRPGTMNHRPRPTKNRQRPRFDRGEETLRDGEEEREEPHVTSVSEP